MEQQKPKDKDTPQRVSVGKNRQGHRRSIFAKGENTQVFHLNEFLAKPNRGKRSAEPHQSKLAGSEVAWSGAAGQHVRKCLLFPDQARSLPFQQHSLNLLLRVSPTQRLPGRGLYFSSVSAACLFNS